MKNLINSLFAVAFVLLLSTSIFAQDKPEHKHSNEAMAKTVKHQCTDECMTKGCDYVKAQEAKTAKTATVKHACTEECHDTGCDFVKAKEARAALDVNNDGHIYECSMKCDASDNAGECSKCGMELKKVSVKES